jgi:hypothetical protein
MRGECKDVGLRRTFIQGFHICFLGLPMITIYRFVDFTPVHVSHGASPRMLNTDMKEMKRHKLIPENNNYTSPFSVHSNGFLLACVADPHRPYIAYWPNISIALITT